MPSDKPTPDEPKQGILEMDPQQDPPAEVEERSYPGDDDPSRDIPAAEVAMTFDGSANGDSADLKPFLERRMKEIAARLAEEARERKSEEEKGNAAA